MFNKSLVNVTGTNVPRDPPSTIELRIPGNRIQLGLCCLNKTLRAQRPSVFTNRTLRLKTFREKGAKEAMHRINLNLNDLETLIHWNVEHDIHVLRLSSEIFPHMSNPEIDFYGFDFCRSRMDEIGDLANAYGHRLTFHPGQFNVLGTPNPETLDKTLLELDRHAEILDILKQGPNGVMVIHGGGVYGDKPASMERWVTNFGKLSDRAAHRLVLENCERSYSVRDCLTISDMIWERYAFSLPVVVDSHHYTCYTKLHPDETQETMESLLPEVFATWQIRGIRPKFHVSEQGSGRVGHHSDYVEEIPDYMRSFPERFKSGLDVMVEAKHKELAIAKLYARYPDLAK